MYWPRIGAALFLSFMTDALQTDKLCRNQMALNVAMLISLSGIGVSAEFNESQCFPRVRVCLTITIERNADQSTSKKVCANIVEN